MSKYTKIPKGARVEKELAGFIDDNSHTQRAKCQADIGAAARMRIYYGSYSQGYKSNFEKVITRFLEFIIYDATGRISWRWCRRFTGRNLKEVGEIWDATAPAIRETDTSKAFA